VKEIRGRAVVIDRADIDTDQIIPAQWLRRIERTGYGAGLFEAWRRDPSFPLNDRRYAGATILIAGANFGCGSSREHAAWALSEYGFQAVVAPSFERDPSTELRIDIAAATLDAAALELHALFPLDPYTRTRLVKGLDDIAATLSHEDAIERYEERRPVWMPSVSYRPHT
jgi:3-isopropylmalate/(R)-2-methylmalate dehydratase small subunit